MKNFWFKRKRYGFGWVPSSWQGWIISLIYILILVKLFTMADIDSHSISDTFIKLSVPFIIVSSIFIVICYKTGEKPKWQWGSKHLDKTE